MLAHGPQYPRAEIGPALSTLANSNRSGIGHIEIYSRLAVNRYDLGFFERVHSQRQRLYLVAELVALDDLGALRGEPLAEPSPRTIHARRVESTRVAAGKSPLHSELTRQFLDLNAHIVLTGGEF